MSAISNSAEVENTQPKPPRAEASAASSETSAACGLDLRDETMAQMI
jgi:hypothetical protein